MQWNTCSPSWQRRHDSRNMKPEAVAGHAGPISRDHAGSQLTFCFLVLFSISCQGNGAAHKSLTLSTSTNQDSTPQTYPQANLILFLIKTIFICGSN